VTIKISELKPSGSALFQDSESFLEDLSDEDIAVVGGFNIALNNNLNLLINLQISHNINNQQLTANVAQSLNNQQS
jgi:hypothetical protein